MTMSNWNRSDGRKARINFVGVYYYVEIYSDRYDAWILDDYYTDRYAAERWLKENGYKRW